MDINNIIRKAGSTGPKVNINVKVSTEVAKWLKEKNYSPTGIFYEALRILKCPHMDGLKTQAAEQPKEEPKNGEEQGNHTEM